MANTKLPDSIKMSLCSLAEEEEDGEGRTHPRAAKLRRAGVSVTAWAERGGVLQCITGCAGEGSEVAPLVGCS